MESLVSDIPSGDGKIDILFLQCMYTATHIHKIRPIVYNLCTEDICPVYLTFERIQAALHQSWQDRPKVTMDERQISARVLLSPLYFWNTVFYPTLQRQNTEISKQIFPEKEYRSLSPNFHIHASMSD